MESHPMHVLLNGQQSHKGRPRQNSGTLSGSSLLLILCLQIPVASVFLNSLDTKFGETAILCGLLSPCAKLQKISPERQKDGAITGLASLIDDGPAMPADHICKWLLYFVYFSRCLWQVGCSRTSDTAKARGKYLSLCFYFFKLIFNWIITLLRVYYCACLKYTDIRIKNVINMELI